MAKTAKAKTNIENQAILSGDCRQAIHWYTNWLAREIQEGHPGNKGLFATNFEEDDQLLLDTAVLNLEAKGIKPLVITGSDLYKQADYLWNLALNQTKFGQPIESKLEAEIKSCPLLLLSGLDTPMSGQQLWYLYHYVLYPAAVKQKPILISTHLGYEEFVTYGAGCEDFEYAGRQITWEKVVALLNATVMNLYQCKQLQQDNLPAMVLPEYRFYRALQERHLSVTPHYLANDYLTDFAIIDETARIKLNIECDFVHCIGSLQDEKSQYGWQKQRDAKLIKDGWQVLRFSFKEITGCLKECVDAVEELCRNNNKKASVGRCVRLPMLSAKINLPARDEDELAAISHWGGPAAIVGGAGTGKSTCIVERIAFLLGQGVSPERILVLSFSPETVKAVKQAAEKIMPGQMLSKINFYAWHDLGLRILKENVSAIKRKLPLKIENNPQKILQKLIAKHTKELDPTALELLGGLDERTAFSMISVYKANLVTPTMVKERAKNELEVLLAKVYFGYEEQLQKANKIDKEDMIGLAAQLLGQDTELRTRYENLFEHIIVDEYQDATSACDFLARVLACPNDNIIFVGNDDETIYESQGAARRLLSETSIRLPNAQCYLLKRNWRAHPQINQHIGHFVNQIPESAGGRGRIEKPTFSGWGEVPTQAIVGPFEFSDEAKQCSWIIEQIEQLLTQGRKPQEIAIICRSKEQISKFEKLLAPQGLVISADMPDMHSLPDEATDVLTFLKLVADPDGPKAKEQFEHICHLRSGAIDTKLSATIAGFAETNNLSYLKALEIYSEIAADPFCTQLEQLVKRIREMYLEKLAPAEIINLLKRPQWLGDYYTTFKLPAHAVYEPLKVMTKMQDEARSYKSVAEFIKNYAPSEGYEQKVEGGHAALNLLIATESKGREFQIVFLPYLMDGIFPDRNQPDQVEEQRIFYVSLSRAREYLYLSCAKKVNNVSCKASPFLQEAGFTVMSYGNTEDFEEPLAPGVPAPDSPVRDIPVQVNPEQDIPIAEIAAQKTDIKKPLESKAASIAEKRSVEMANSNSVQAPTKKSEASIVKSTNIFALIPQSDTEIIEEFAPTEVTEKKIDLSETVRKARAAKAIKQKCKNCQSALEAGARFCGECGADQTAATNRLCKACSGPLEEGEKFCGHCGSQQ